MLLKMLDAINLIHSGKLLHIAGSEDLLRKLPKGNWIGGTTEFFVTPDGPVESTSQLFVSEIDAKDFKISIYDESDIQNIADDSFENGYTIVLLPFNSAVHKFYAEKAADFQGMFMKNVLGWVPATNPTRYGQTPVAVDGLNGEYYSTKAVAMHIGLDSDVELELGIVNIFEADENSPTIEFLEEGFKVKRCLVNGEEMLFSDYINKNGINTKQPIIGEYSGTGINVSFKSVGRDHVKFYSPIFKDIKYKVSRLNDHYEETCEQTRSNSLNYKVLFACNSSLNYWYGHMDGKKLNEFYGPMSVGQIAYQLVNQTVVYIAIK